MLRHHEHNFQVRDLRCVEYKLKYNIKYKIFIMQSDTTLYFIKIELKHVAGVIL